MQEPAVPASDTPENRRRGRVLLIGTVAVALVIVLLLHPASHFAPSNSFNAGSAGTLVSYDYSCCQAPMIDTIYRPGELISARWIRATDAMKTTRLASIVLSMKLSGPYRSVIRLKLSSVGRHARRGTTFVAARRNTLLSTVAANPWSTLRLPATAGAGYYNLTFTVHTKNLTVSGASIIRVALK